MHCIKRAATPPQFRVFCNTTVLQHTTLEPRHADHSHGQGQPPFANVHSCSSALFCNSSPLLDTPPPLTVYCGLQWMWPFLSHHRSMSQSLLDVRQIAILGKADVLGPTVSVIWCALPSSAFPPQTFLSNFLEHSAAMRRCGLARS